MNNKVKKGTDNSCCTCTRASKLANNLLNLMTENMRRFRIFFRGKVGEKKWEGQRDNLAYTGNISALENRILV